ncbi:peptidyl-prolyl isomerase CWC27 [Cordyceps militaris CM01]|uniref:peptidylprolyl isomerase n=1 Tax=Cordyceps militaris (strain CM01) TaxID=983644 RepID=G3JI33_CORMM|nr:peptidyl-prolyl isomerase CWC27 [Cordyceps militaris CM01]EGX90986.1 peptidyl-prolyl isomerase CWC27 [Cordyceps militaris CM01]
MSAIYNLEPQPTASAVIHTTLGEILVELFAKQTPLTCRNFLQLSLDGYYDGTIFHRLVPNFILQGGDPTGTGNGGESIYDGGAFGGDLDPWPMDQRHGKNAGPTGINFRDEFHSRLKFNRRGLLAMANEGHVDTNGSQFFFTLDKTDELNGKNTLFGRVAGDTIYNLAKIGESEVEEGTDRPMYAVKIERIEILVNPFEDMEKRTRIAAHTEKRPAEKEKKKKRKAGKQLLSFGDDEGDDEVPSLPKKAKFDTRIVMDDGSADGPPKEKSTSKAARKEKTNTPKTSDDGAEAQTIGVAAQPAETEAPPRREQIDDNTAEEYPDAPKKTALQIANEEMAALKASMRRTIHSATDDEPRKKSTLESMIPENSIRGARKRRAGGASAISSDDQATIKFLKGFQSRLDKAAPGKELTAGGDEDDGEVKQDQTGEDDEAGLCDLHFIANCQSCTSWDKQEKEESDDEGWMSHQLSFAADKLGKDLRNRKKGEEELVVIDPRSKEQSMRAEKRAKRDARSGGSGRQWDQRRDQARNARMSQAASLAGRGAK